MHGHEAFLPAMHAYSCCLWLGTPHLLCLALTLLYASVGAFFFLFIFAGREHQVPSDAPSAARAQEKVQDHLQGGSPHHFLGLSTIVRDEMGDDPFSLSAPPPPYRNDLSPMRGRFAVPALKVHLSGRRYHAGSGSVFCHFACCPSLTWL